MVTIESWCMAVGFFNALVGLMMKDSLLDIDAPMDIVEWQGNGRKAITLHDLMQSGLVWHEDYNARSDVNIMLHQRMLHGTLRALEAARACTGVLTPAARQTS